MSGHQRNYHRSRDISWTYLVVRKHGGLRSLEVGPDLSQVVPVLLAQALRGKQQWYEAWIERISSNGESGTGGRLVFLVSNNASAIFSAKNRLQTCLLTHVRLL